MGTQLGVVHWRSRITGHESHGQPMPIDQARDVAELGNRKYHMKIDLSAWAVECSPSSKPTNQKRANVSPNAIVVSC